ncbi:CDP-diacylglycerol--glycerol-3-phosphate 3-phosphatidyltransferase [Mycoblastus sanguinarius]|nr:CDP-diacylglycerol--glycerol-3-phosphate 3-phosphatidyltransferase [Mycoblastus sanguinarius]
MLVRRIRANPRPWLLVSTRRLPWHQRFRSQFTTAPLASSQTPTYTSPLAALASDLDRLAPRIDIDADQIEILGGPKEFYETLKKKIHGGKRRIYLSTLYIGKTEHDLISSIRETLLHNGPEFKVSLLTDALRGTREAPDPSCASLLASLVAEFPDRVEVRMYHTPNLTGFRKALIPKRINEGWGLQHIKLYGIDDEVILSGANLSNDYFTNRQDRYHVFSSKPVTDYFFQIHQAVCSISYVLHPSDVPSKFALEWPASNSAPNPLEAPKKYIEAATSLLLPLVEPTPSQSSPTTSTSIYPLLCHPPTLNNELPAFTALLARPIKSYTFTAGYFNPHPIITSSLLSVSALPASAPGIILTASPYANGFFGSKGISGLLPPAYTHLSLRFLQAARGKNIQLREWQRGIVGQENGWTYHAKGLWVTLPREATSSPAQNKSTELQEKSHSDAVESSEPSITARPSVTLIGSSNYTTRSYGLDLEVGAMVVTRDEGLMRKWKREEEMLLGQARVVDEDELQKKERRAGWRVRLAMWIVKVVGGAL